MGLKITDQPTVLDVVRYLGTKTDTPDLAQYGSIQSIIRLIVRNECHNVVELHSPHSRLGCTLCKAFDDLSLIHI